MARLVRKNLGDIQLVGTSLAGEETVVAATTHNVCFDVGRAPREIISIDNVCVSHGHMDHAAGVAYYLSQRSFVGNSPGRIIVSRHIAPLLQKLMDIWGDIEGHPSPGIVYGVEPMEDVAIRRGLFIRPFKVNHAANALGFTLIEVRQKLNPEFAGRTGPELVALKNQGVPIEHAVEIPLLTYTGDTAIGRWLELDFVRASRGVILECTFFEREHVHRARAGKHIHVVDLPQIYDAIPEASFMLTHVTHRTDVHLAKTILQQALATDDVARTEFFMDRPARRSFGNRQPDRRAAIL